MKRFVFICICIITKSIWAQNDTPPCWFDIYQRQNKAFIQNVETTICTVVQYPDNASPVSHHIKIIPVVVHVIHNGGVENISDAQIQSQIDVLNEDFRKIAGTNGNGNGVDTEIEFRLAKISPNGHCTNGIVRVQSMISNHLTYQRSLLKKLSYWLKLRRRFK